MQEGSERCQAQSPLYRSYIDNIAWWSWGLEFGEAVVMTGKTEQVKEKTSLQSACPKCWLLWNQKPAEQGDKYSCRFPLQLLTLFRRDAAGSGHANPFWSFLGGGGACIFFPETEIFITPNFFSYKEQGFSGHSWIYNLVPQRAETAKPAILTEKAGGRHQLLQSSPSFPRPLWTQDVFLFHLHPQPTPDLQLPNLLPQYSFPLI